MKKFLLFLLTALFMATVLVGCGHVEPATPDTGLVQTPSTNAPIIAPPADPGDTDNPVNAGDSEPMPAEYAKNLLSLTDTATSNGISYYILDVQWTKEFGSRTLENLNDLSREGTDKQGNLLGDEDYLFLTIQFTNTTDQTVEILRNQGGLRIINPEGQVLHCNSETVYCDQKWDGGTPGEMFHWVLAPNESVTSEMGWIIRGQSETSKALLGDSGDWSLYYEVEVSDDSTENYFIDLEVE